MQTADLDYNKIASRPLTHEPGEQFTYGLSIDIVARLIEVPSGQPLDRDLAEYIFQPLGMENTYFYLPEEKTARLVELYSKARPEDELTVHQNQTFRTFAKYCSMEAVLMASNCSAPLR